MTDRQRPWFLSDRQRHQVMVAAVRLPPSQRYHFIAEVEKRLTGPGGSISDDGLGDLLSRLADKIAEPVE